MAMALEREPLKAENLEKLQKLSEASLAFVKEALDIEESLINDSDSIVRNTFQNLLESKF